MRWRNKTKSVAACVLEGFRHSANAPDDMGNDGCSETLELLPAVGLGIWVSPTTKSIFPAKSRFFENELGNENPVRPSTAVIQIFRDILAGMRR
jgi:hypothetical protein